VNLYRKVSIDPKVEIKAIGALRKLGDRFKMVSKTEYYLSEKQCRLLKKLKIPYKQL
jgi:hypothetical protein